MYICFTVNNPNRVEKREGEKRRDEKATDDELFIGESVRDDIIDFAYYRRLIMF